MPASIVARVVRMPVLAAVVASALAACSNDPTSPVTPRAQASSVNRSRTVSGDTAVTASDVTVPWYRNGDPVGASTTVSDVTVPWYRNNPPAPATATASDVTVPWY